MTAIPNDPRASTENRPSAPSGRARRTAYAGLSTLAGFVDGAGFVMLGGYFVSFMSGNTTQAAAELTGGSFGAAAFAALLVVAFVAGAIAGTATAVRWGACGVLTLMTGGLALAAVCAVLTSAPPAGVVLAASMGAANTVFSRDGAAPLGLTYMTGQLMKLAEGIVAALRGNGNAGWTQPLLLWTGIAAGAVLGAAATRAVGAPALAIPAGATLVVTVVAWMRRARSSGD